MRRIQKAEEPPSLKKYREQLPVPPPEGSWDRFPSKDDAYLSVTKEQRQLCAFCQGSMAWKKTSIKLAHIVPQRGSDDGERLQLTWSNIVGACLGGAGPDVPKVRPKLMHCDSLQANTRLVPQLDPVQFVNGSLYYNSDGEIHSRDPAVEAQLENVLGLNRKPVLRKRLNALDGEDGIKNVVKKSPAPEQKRQELIALLDPDHPSDQPLLEYADFLLWHLRYGDLAHSP